MAEPNPRPDAEGPVSAPCPSYDRCPLGPHAPRPRPEVYASPSKPASGEAGLGYIARAYLWLTMHAFYAFGCVVGVPTAIGFGVARWFRLLRRPRERARDREVHMGCTDGSTPSGRDQDDLAILNRTRLDALLAYSASRSTQGSFQLIPWWIWAIVGAVIVLGIAILAGAISIG